MLRIGLISDTHGVLRPQALDALRGSAHLIHAGDIGSAEILRALAAIAPITAVRGNNDSGTWASHLPEAVTLDLQGVRIHVVHDLHTLDTAACARGVAVVVSGHSHRPRIERRDGVLYVNPGSAGPRRFKLPVSVGELRIGRSAGEGELHARIVELSL